MNTPNFIGMTPVHKEVIPSSEIKPYYSFEPFEFYGFRVTPTNYPVVCGHIEAHFHDLVPKLAEELDSIGVEIRVCSECGNFMVQGYCVGDGEAYYCERNDSECLHKHFTEAEWEEAFENDEGYWTEWEAEEPVYTIIEAPNPPTDWCFTFNGYEVTVYNFREIWEIIVDLFEYQRKDFEECLLSELGIEWNE